MGRGYGTGVRVKNISSLIMAVAFYRLGHVKECKIPLFTGKEDYGDPSIYHCHRIHGFYLTGFRTILESRLLPCAIVLDSGITPARDSDTTKDHARDF
jgi:hypothetical protein